MNSEMIRGGADFVGFEIDFDFRRLTGPDRTACVSALRLEELAKRVADFEAAQSDPTTSAARRQLGLAHDLCLDHLADDAVPLPVLVIQETGTTGMYGPWGKNSRMYLALASVGYTPKKEGGGSFGYGKAGMIRASATRTVIAYSCFRERDDDPGVTRRLFGMTYWGDHAVGEGHFVGFARLGQQRNDGGVEPFENKEADSIACAMGLDRRDHQKPEGLGTTFLVVDPTVRPDDLRRAVERNWWPALEDPELDFGVRIVRSDRTTLYPQPKRDKVLRSFIRAYEVATVPQDNPSPEERRVKMQPPGSGRLGLVADLNGWSYPESAGETEIPGGDRSLVALLREPRMVVEYFEVGRGQTRPVIRGAFVADAAIDQVLRDTEPKGHDRWLTQESETADADAVLVATNVLSKIKQNVARFRQTLKPPPRPSDKIVLPQFDSMMRKILAGTAGGPKPPPRPPRPFTIHVTPMAEAVGDDRVRVSGQAEFGLNADIGLEVCGARIQLHYKLDEDGLPGPKVALRITPPPGFVPAGSGDGYMGELQQGTSAVFEFVSEAHSNLWTGRFTASADPHGDLPHATSRS